MPEAPPLKLGEEVDKASTALDIETIPLGPSLFQLVGLIWRDALLEKQANEEFAKLQEQINQSLYHPKIGYLLEVSVYVNEWGHIVLPHGQLLYPIGIGTEPIDAYAEHLSKDTLRAGGPMPGGLNNGTFFIWITKKGEVLQAGTIPKEFRRFFIEKSKEERDRRKVLADWRRVLPNNPYRSIARAQYWIEVERTHAVLIQDELRHQEIKALSNQMKNLEIRVNVLYQQYQEVLEALVRQHTYYNALGTVSSVCSIMRSAIDLGDLLSTKDASKVSGSELNPPVDVPGAIEMTQEAIRKDGDQMRGIRQSLRIEYDNLLELDSILDLIYKDFGVYLPNKAILPRVLE
jgi:hypothetical protein